MTDCAAGEDREIGRSAADVHDADAEILLVLVQHRERGGQRLQHDVLDHQPAAAYAFGDVLDRGNRSGDDVHLHLEPDAAHAQGLAHVLLPVDDEFLRQDVQHLLIVGNRDCLGRFHDAVDVGLGDFLFLDRYHPAGIEASDVASRNAGKHFGDRAIGHQLCLFQHALDRRHRGLDVDDDALFQAPRGLRSQADDVQLLLRRDLGDDGNDLRRADVESDDQIFRVSHHASFTTRFSLSLSRRITAYAAFFAARSLKPGTRAAKPLRYRRSAYSTRVPARASAPTVLA